MWDSRLLGKAHFNGCRALQRVTIPSSVTKWGNYAFYRCTNLSSVQFGEGLEIIGEGAFDRCTALRSVTVPSSVTELGIRAFGDCTNLTEVILLCGERLLNRGFFDRGLFSGQGVLNKDNLDEMIGHGNVRDDCPLTTDVFSHYYRLSKGTLQELAIPSTVTKLGDCAFWGCRNLAKVQFEEGTLEFIEGGAFCCCKRQVTVPSSVIMLGEEAFWDCSNLAEVQLNEGLKTIGNNTFYDCKALQQVTLPSSVTKLRNYAFSYCSNLASVHFGKGT
ncbi:hypothetical protein THAOC_20582, partial [Thalassiosira oceanica]